MKKGLSIGVFVLGILLIGVERIVGCLSILGAGQRIEQSGFANIGQTDDT